MNDATLEGVLIEALSMIAEDESYQEDIDGAADLANADAISFKDEGVLTRDRGIVLRLANGAEFQITIIQSKTGAGDDGDDEQEA